MPQVSVVMVAHKSTPYLKPAIESVFAQTFTDFEFVFVDNGARFTDGEVGEYCRDPRWRWIRLPEHAGIGRAHNAGIAACAGEFVALLDSDDVALPERFAREVGALRADRSLGLVSCMAVAIDRDGRLTGRVEFCVEGEGDFRAYAMYAGVIVTPGAMGRAEVFRRFPYRPVFPYAADLDFQARVSEAYRIAVIPEILLHYRVYPEQTTQSKIDSIEKSRCAIQILTAQRRSGQPEDPSLVERLQGCPTQAWAWREGARAALETRAPVLAAFQARRHLVTGRSVSAIIGSVGVLVSALARHPSLAARTLSMYLRGPVKALGVRVSHPA